MAARQALAAVAAVIGAMLLVFSAMVIGAELLGADEQSPVADAPGTESSAAENGDEREKRNVEGPCYMVTDVDPKTTYCRVEERPVDLRVENFHGEAHNVSIRIANSSGVVYTENVTLGARGEFGWQTRFEDVIRVPDEYRIRGTLERGGNNSMALHVDEYYCESCTPRIQIGRDGEIDVGRTLQY